MQNEVIFKAFIEFSEKNGYIYSYILIHYDFKLHYIKFNNNETIHVSIDYKTDTQCFQNKCFNNICTYNIEVNVECWNIL